MTFSISKEYSSLYETWFKEITSDDLQPISLNFYNQYEETLHQSILDSSKDNQVEFLISERMHYMLYSTMIIRKKKIMKLVLNKNEVNSALLTNSEKFFYDIFSNLESLILSNSYENIAEELSQHIIALSQSNVLKINDSLIKDKNDLPNLKIRALKYIPEFIDENNNLYGPIDIDQVVELPKSICINILIPKKYVEEI